MVLCTTYIVFHESDSESGVRVYSNTECKHYQPKSTLTTFHSGCLTSLLMDVEALHADVSG